MTPFRPGGPSHIAALLAAALLVVAAALLVRRGGALRRATEVSLAPGLLGGAAAYVALELSRGTASVWTFLPFHLCDMAIFVAAFALLTHHRRAAELLYFWALGGTLLAIAMPDVAYDVPDAAFFFYFGLHAGVVAAAAALTLGVGLRPAPRAPLRAWLATNVYAALVAAVNLVFDANYMYLCRKPDGASLLDWFGPWPIYVLVADVFALGLFALLALPIRPARGQRGRPA